MVNGTESVRGLVLVLASSLATSVILSWWWNRSKPEGNDDFVAYQGKPITDKSGTSKHAAYIHERLTMNQIRRRSQRLLKLAEQRRSLRFFSSQPVPRDVMANILRTACTAPSGAHRQPWTFCAISNQKLKQKIREMVEKEETINYKRRMKETWVDDVKEMVSQLHETSDVTKPYLTEAPWIVVVFKQTYTSIKEEGEEKRLDNYYVQESVGIACGILSIAIHNANLVTLTSTPMGAEKGIRELLERPSNEKVFLLMPVGFPAENATVPYRHQQRKSSSETIVWKT